MGYQYQSTGRPHKFSIEDVIDSTNDYFTQCDTNEKRYTYAGYRFHLMHQLDMGLQMYYEYRDSEIYKDIFNWAYARIVTQQEENALDGNTNTNATFTFQMLKHHAKYTDKSDIEKKTAKTVTKVLSLNDQIREAEALFLKKKKKK